MKFITAIAIALLNFVASPAHAVVNADENTATRNSTPTNTSTSEQQTVSTTTQSTSTTGNDNKASSGTTTGSQR